VKFNTQTVILQLPMDSMENFCQVLRENLNIEGEFSLQFFYQKKDFKDFIDLIDLEQLKAKMPMIKVYTKAHRFWTFTVNSEWVTKGHAENKYESLLVKEGDKVYNTEVMEKFTNLANGMGLESLLAYKIYSISNPMIIGVFDSYRALLFGKQRQSPQLFCKDDWKQMADAEQRKAYLDWLEAYIGKFDQLNNDKKGLPPVIPMIQGTSEEAVWQICQQGFGVTAVTDDGYYGRGIYFTSSYSYASRYSKDSPKEPGFRVFLLSMVVPGNPFPVTEDPWDADHVIKQGYHGQACRPGYQSHYTLVDAVAKKSYPIKYPPPFAKEKVSSELVVFEWNQTLPLFVFYTK